MPVVLLAHGSRHPHGIASIERLRDAVAEDGLDARTAYLDLNQPDLNAAAQSLRADGHRRAVVVPLLFTPAFHARTDAPAHIAAAQQRTGVELITADIIGTPDDLIGLLLAAGNAAGIPADGPVLLTSVGSSRQEANADVADLAARVAGVRQAPVSAAFATCEPRATRLLGDSDRADAPVGVLALFVGHGLLLDKITAAADVPVAEPLEGALAPLIRQRYGDALSR